MGTIVNIKVERSLHSKKAVEEAVVRMKELEAKFNRFDKKSEVYKINIRGKGSKAEVSQDFRNLMNLAIYLNKITGGAFDVTLGKPGGKLDFGAIAKGYIVDEAVNIFKVYGVKSAIVDAGGDIFCVGDNKGNAWTVGIRDPKNKKNIIAKIKVRDRAVATSGAYEKKYPHIIDPRTGYPVKNNVLSATVISRKCATADALATALFVLKPEEGLALIEELDDADCVIICEEKDKIRFIISSDFMEGVEILGKSSRSHLSATY
ncbi:MAG: FAD:protein FMN transferase [Candidatus Omnitrophica bacterium]|nr:FAD:protein FMN transferase [Candidatus Omnitrophota bacterium]